MDQLVASVAPAAITAVVSALGAWVVARRTVKPADVTAEAAWQKAMNEGFTALTARYETANREMAAKIDMLNIVVRELGAHIEHLEAILREEGLHVPPRVMPTNFLVLEGGKPA